MLKMIRLLMLLSTLLFLTGCDDGLYSGTLIFSGEHRFESGAHFPGDVFLRAGTVEFAAGSRVDGMVAVLGGSLATNGEIGGDLFLLDGALALGPEALVQGDLRLGGGTVEWAETAVIQGDVISGSELQIPLEVLERRRGWDDWLRLQSAALLLAGLGALLVRSRPRAVANVGLAVMDHPVVSGALGLLVALVLPALLVMMAFTVILIPLVIIVGLLLILFLGYGLVGIGHQLGMWLRKFMAARWGRSLSRPSATFLGTLLLALLFEIPYLGDGLLVVTAVLVSGAVMLTHFGIRRYVPPIPYDEGADSAGYGREWLQNRK